MENSRFNLDIRYPDKKYVYLAPFPVDMEAHILIGSWKWQWVYHIKVRIVQQHFMLLEVLVESSIALWVLWSCIV